MSATTQRPIDVDIARLVAAFKTGGREAASLLYAQISEQRKLKTWEQFALVDKFRDALKAEGPAEQPGNGRGERR